MNRILKILFGIILLIVLVVFGIYIFLLTQKPQYSGYLKLKGVKSETEVFFDDYGIPHIYGKNAEDAYFALGYVHAQDRLFQMEMIRRISAGRLSEIFGSSTLDVDRFFRMLGIADHAEESAKLFLGDRQEPYQKAAFAYLDGINAYIEQGKTPLEFRLLGIPKEKYTSVDMYLVASYMSFVFQMAFKTDPLMSRIEKKYGEKYLKDLALNCVPGTLKGISHPNDSVQRLLDSDWHPEQFTPCSYQEIEIKLPVQPWMGSNSWALSPQKCKSEKVLFANDTHIGYGQPAAWYEAHLEYPGFGFYGNYFAGFPFAPVGHTTKLAWGMTIFENDDLDFFEEKTDPQHVNQVWFIDHWENLQLKNELIKVKDSSDVILVVRESHHGPICNDVISDFKDVTSEPVSASWTFLKFPSNLFQVCYDFDHATNISEVRLAASKVIAPGLNVIYGDDEGNISWWAAAKLVKRPAHVNPVLLLDGSTGKDEWLGWYDFKDNPQSENPANGFVYSCNNQPDTTAGLLYPGYYVPEDRAVRVTQVLGENKKFDFSDMRKLQNDVTTPVASAIAKSILIVISDEVKNKSPNHIRCSQLLNSWKGEHGIHDVSPTIYYKLLYRILFNALGDELDEKLLNQFFLTHIEKNTIAPLMKNDTSAWWDNINTKHMVETRRRIFDSSFDQTISELEMQLGKNPDDWQWGKVHVLEHVHAIGRKKPFDKFFNVGPFPAPGGRETMNQQGFELNKAGIYKVKFGPAIRRVIDFADPENGRSILPTGNSGNAMSKHYSDQAGMFIKGETRKEMMNRNEIEKKCKDKLTLLPEGN